MFWMETWFTKSIFEQKVYGLVAYDVIIMDLEKLRLSRATSEHFQEILEISKGVYDGKQLNKKMLKATLSIDLHNSGIIK